jgi:transcriptional regulator CtsR
MGISDMITEFIKRALKDSGGVLELQRSELAEQFGCVPSQINYVISTRFSPEHGYIVESRRGGGGYIRIKRVDADEVMLLMHTINSVGEEIDSASCAAILSNLVSAGALIENQANIIAAALSGRSLSAVPPVLRPRVRASILKQTLLICIDDLSEN